MCIIFYKEAGKDIKEDWLDNSAESNPDGFGLSYIDSEKGLTTYHTMNYKEFKKEYFRLESNQKDTSFILHFRKNTHGSNSFDNCHPFTVGGLAVFHNGVITHCSPDKDDKRSDTRIFCEDVLGGLQNGWFDNETVLDLLEVYIGGSKLVVMDSEGSVTFLNEKSGHWVDGIWCSNYSYFPNTRSVQKTKPFTWNANKPLKKGEENKGSKQTIYLHPAGIFSRFSDGKRYRWFPKIYSWCQIDKSGERTWTGVVYYNEPPCSKTYNIMDVSYYIGGESKPLVFPLKKIEEKVSCDWCGGMVEKSDLKAYTWCQDVVDDDDVTLVCNSCQDELLLSEMMQEKANCNIDYYIKNNLGQRAVWSL